MERRAVSIAVRLGVAKSSHIDVVVLQRIGGAENVRMS